MDLFYIAYCAALFLLPMVLYKLTLSSEQGREKRMKDWYYALKRILCWQKINTFMNRRVNLPQTHPRTPGDKWDEDLLTFHGVDLKNNSLYLRFAVGKMADTERSFAEILLQLRLADGRTLTLPDGVLLCSLRAHEWRTKILTITRLLDGNYRIVFNGFLQLSGCTAQRDDFTRRHVAFNCLYSRGSDTLLYPKCFDRSSFADAVCRVQWRDGNWTDKLGDQIGESNFGMLHGTVRSDHFGLDLVLALPAYQSRRCGTADRYECSRSIAMLTLDADGTMVYAENKRTASNPSAQVRHGAVLMPNGDCAYIKKGCDLPLPDSHGKMASMTVHIYTALRQIKLFLSVDERSEVIHSSKHWGCGYDITSTLAETATAAGCGVTSLLFFKRTQASQTSEVAATLAPLVGTQYNHSATIQQTPVSFNLSLPLDSLQAQNLALTGGKAQSLSILAGLQKELNFRVPNGYVITTKAMEAHMATDGAAAVLRAALVKLKMAGPQSIKTSCEHIRQLILTTPVSQELQRDVSRMVRELMLTYRTDKLSYAVRSSGVSEDTEVTSAAGQNESYLGCRTEDDVLSAVRQCWASLYSFRSVEYRRNRGLDVESTMGVVVQAMIDSRIAGVLFTCDLDGSPERLRITSNYGLGESIVSGEEAGDIVYVTRTWNNNVCLGSTHVNKKKVKITLGDNASGTRTVHLSDAHSRAMSICTEEALTLGKVATQLEEKYGRHLDIEWAFDGDHLVLLQARPVTFLENWTDYELEHEFDSPVFCAENVYTTANVKEVIPGAMTPLSTSTIIRGVDLSVAQSVSPTSTATSKRYLLTMQHHVFMDFFNVLMALPSDTVDLTTRSIDVSVCGHYVTTSAMLRRAIAINGRTTMWKKLRSIIDMLKCAWRVGPLLEEARQIAGEGFPQGGTSLMDMLSRIDRHLQAFQTIINTHSIASRASSFYQMLSMNILSSEDGVDELTPEKFAQIALLFSNGSGVISAEIPADLEAIAIEIRRSEHRSDFINKEAENAEEILSLIPGAHKKYLEFVQKHGHRSFREFEIMEVSWASNQKTLMKMLQTLAKLDEGTKKAAELSPDDVVDKLGSKMNKRFLKFLIGRCRSGVVNRENTKSEVVRHIDTLREAFTTLAQRLTQLHILPQVDLVYFLTYNEVKHLITAGDPTLIAKAMRRKRLYETWNSYKFPEISFGMPQVLVKPAEDEWLLLGGDAELRGTPVCGGKVTARCCCIDDLGDIGELQQGDVLVTHGTDVGWTPYFPMLSGVVTELGGLISHGAVVAREYGLPCLVGVSGALRTFRTGDRVVLDAGAGRICRLDTGSGTGSAM